MEPNVNKRSPDEEEGLIEGESLLGHANNFSEDDYNRKLNFPPCKVHTYLSLCSAALSSMLTCHLSLGGGFLQPMIYHNIDRDVQDERLRYLMKLCYYAWYGRCLLPPPLYQQLMLIIVVQSLSILGHIDLELH